MPHAVMDRVRRDPRFQYLERTRLRFSVVLTVIMLTIYFGFIAVVAFAPKILAQPLWEGEVVTVGFPVGLGVILSAVVLTGIYVFRANNEFDRLNKEIVEGAK